LFWKYFAGIASALLQNYGSGFTYFSHVTFEKAFLVLSTEDKI